MGLFSRPDQPPVRPSRFRLFLVIMVIYGCVKVFGHTHFHLPQLNLPQMNLPQLGLPQWTLPHLQLLPRPAIAPPAAIVEIPDNASTDVQMAPFGGRRIWGNGTAIDLGDRRNRLPSSLLSRFFPDPLILPSCLTQPPPPPAAAAQKPLPVHDDWPGFYGAPWIARMNGNLLVLLDVYAPRNTALPVPAPKFEFYPHYNGAATPAQTASATAQFHRGSKAVLYRVFTDGPFRCLDLVVGNADNFGTGHLYYQKDHHYYELTATFAIQQ